MFHSKIDLSGDSESINLVTIATCATYLGFTTRKAKLPFLFENNGIKALLIKPFAIQMLKSTLNFHYWNNQNSEF